MIYGEEGRGRNAPFFYMKTVRGIYHDLKESEYTFTAKGMTFYFSSRFYKVKFMNLYVQEVARFNRSLNNIYKDKFNIQMDLLALVRLYCLIEKRGFYIIYEGVELTCLEDLRFVVTANYKPKLDESTN